MIEAEGKTIFHSGDLNWWAWSPKERPDIIAEEEEANFKAEIANIKSYLGDKTIDMAFVPTDGRLGYAAYKAAEYFIDELHPVNLAPMHFWEDYDVANGLLNKVFGKGTNILSINKRNEIIYED